MRGRWAARASVVGASIYVAVSGAARAQTRPAPAPPLQRATDIARAMVTEWGMSDALGAVNYDGNKRNKFLDIPLGPERGNYAEDTARLIDSEVKRIMTEAHTRARTILTEKSDMLEKVTRQLLELEVMEGDTLRAILGIPPAPAHEPGATVPLPPELR